MRKKNVKAIIVNKYEISMSKTKGQRETGKRKHDAETKRKTRSSKQHEEEPPATCSKVDTNATNMVNYVSEF